MVNREKEAIITAYASINGVSRRVVTKEPHASIIANAAKEVWLYDGLYPDETPELKEKRLDCEEVEHGDVLNLVRYFRVLYPNGFGGIPSDWGIIFTMYNRMKELTADSEVLGSGTAELAEDDSSDNNSILKEDHSIMAKVDETKKAISEMDKEFGLGVQSGLPQVEDADEMVAAARKVADDQSVARQQFSENSHITRGIVARVGKEEILRDGLKAIGMVNPEKFEQVKKAIKDKAGIEWDEVSKTFITTNCPTKEDSTKAIELYETIDKLSKGDTSVKNEFDVYVSQAPRTLKGVYLQEAGKGEAVQLTLNEVVNEAMEKGYGFIATPDSENTVALFVKKASNRGGVGNGTGATGRSAKKNAEGAYVGIAHAVFRNKEILLKNCDVVMKVTSKVDDKATGEKSAAFFKYTQAGKVTKKGNLKEMTYRLPLLTPKYVLEFNDTLKEDFKPGTSAAGGVQQTVDAEGLKKARNDFYELLGLASSGKNASKSATLSKVREAGSAMKADKAKDQASDIANENL